MLITCGRIFGSFTGGHAVAIAVMRRPITFGGLSSPWRQNVFTKYTNKSLGTNLHSTLSSRSCTLSLLAACRRLRVYATQVLRISNSAQFRAAVETTTKLAQGKIPPKASDVRRLLSLARPERWRIVAAICFLFVSSAVTMAVPFGIGRVIDIIYTTTAGDGTDMTVKLRSFCQILFVVFVCGALANFARVYLLQTSGNRIVNSLRTQLFTSIIRQDIAFFDKNKTGELINRLSTDTSLVGQAVTTNVSDGLRSVTQTIGGVSMMVFMSPKLALVALSIVPPVAIASRIYGRYLQRITKEVQDSLADATQVAEEKLSNMRTVRAFVQEGRELTAYSAKTGKVLDLGYREALARGAFWASTGFSGNVIILSVIYCGGIMMQDSQITVGALSSFMLYAAFVGVSIGGIGTFYTELMRGIGASSRLWQLVDGTPTIPLNDGRTIKHVVGNVEFRDVVFSYPLREGSVIFDGLNLSVPAGSVTAVVGPSGSGKSTLAGLLLRYYDPSSGAVTVDGVDIKELNAQWLRGNIGIVNQEPTLFSTSVSDNILYGAVDPSSVTTEQIFEAARMANAFEFIQGFSKGFDTLVGERGIMLSGGQKQRIAIARAIIKNPRILLLDEATSALDSESEHLVQDALERVMVGRTVIVIAHRLSTIRRAHQIAVLDCGRIVEIGDYQNLMSHSNGLFKRLVERQTIISK